MLYYLMLELSNQVPALNVFRYITFRTGGATITALLMVFLFGPSIIKALKVRQGKGQPKIGSASCRERVLRLG